MSKAIGILGCGWLGTSLGISLIADGYSIKGSTTSEDKMASLAEKGFTPFLIRLEDNAIEGAIDGFLNQVDVLVINVPPNLRKHPESDYEGKMKILLEAVKQNIIPKVIFISSTSVYGDIDGDITEDTEPMPSTNSGKQLLASERLFLNETAFSATVIRFGGLIGEDRHPVHHLSNRELTNGEELVNLIHRKDCIHMIRTIIENGYWNEVFNGVYPHHPTKKSYYTSEAKKRGISPPVYQHSPIKISKKKVIFRNFFVKNHVLTTSISS